MAGFSISAVTELKSARRAKAGWWKICPMRCCPASWHNAFPHSPDAIALRPRRRRPRCLSADQSVQYLTRSNPIERTRRKTVHAADPVIVFLDIHRSHTPLTEVHTAVGIGEGFRVWFGVRHAQFRKLFVRHPARISSFSHSNHSASGRQPIG